ncbi:MULTISPECIES: D-alanyl-D-alanine carboxypeptidase family protein [unclassified Streptomyces]|uniref:D-alanyl-D-alanine carboxypeptidase family protein n=1 Tax=unclassified Streptomyces TaxID=2593676 RepID=UPI002E288FD2|nr:serine hydrolase [Streptomyces sp. NBC_01439]
MKAVTVAGGSSDDPEIEAVSTAPEGTPEATAETGTEVEAGAEASAEAGTEPGSEAAPRAEAEPKGRADAELPGGARSETATEAEASAGPARTGAEADAAKPKADAGTDTGPEAEPKSRADANANANANAELPGGPDSPAASERAGTTGAELPDDVRPEDEADPEVTARSRAEAAAAEPKTSPDADPAPAPEAEPKGRAEAELPDEVRPEAEASAGPARTGTEADPAKPKADAGTDTEPEAEPKGRADAELPGGADSPAASERTGTTGAELPDDVRPEADTGADPEDEAESEEEGGSERAGEAAAGLPDEARSETDARPEAEAEVTARSGAGAEAGPAGAAGDDGEPVSGDRADTGPAPEAGPVVEAASDETMLIALPKQKPAEADAPRKTPTWAREVEPDPERTSQFVALKDVDLPAPVAPRAQPQSPGDQVARQAPAVPLPPLDLLAELTNTPPPAETPRRTAVRRVKIWTPILLVLVGAGAGAQLMRPLPAPQLVAAETDRTIDGQFSVPWPAKGQGAVRISGSGDIGTFGEQKPVPTASVAKVMTAYVILKGHPLRKSDPGPDITIDAKTVADGKSDNESRVEGLTAGQKFSQQDVLKMLMIPSGNNAARLLARWDTGTDSEAAFVAKMNAAAKELGMTNTTYTDPSGLDSGTVSTAVDQLKLAEAVMKDEVFRSIVALPNASIKGVSTRLENNNTLLSSTIRGIKTGSSTPAGGALMWAAYKSVDGKDQLILGTLMDQHVDGPDENGANSLKLVLANSKTIIEGVRTALASAPVIRKGDVVGHVDDGLGGRTPLVATKDLNVIGVPGQQLKLSLKAGADAGAGAGPLPHSAKAGSEVAVLTVGSGEGARSVPVAVKGALVEPSFGTRLTRGR